VNVKCGYYYVSSIITSDKGVTTYTVTMFILASYNYIRTPLSELHA